MAHITGGGLPENLPRCLPKGLQACIDVKSWQRPEIFEWLKDVGNIPEMDLWNTFNLGVGFCLVTSSDVANSAVDVCLQNGLQAWIMGHVEESNAPENKGIKGIPVPMR